MNAPFIQQARLSASKKAGSPDDRFDAALRAEDVEQKEQRGEKEEAHELFHALHPRARLRAGSAARRVARRARNRAAHAGRDGDKHRAGCPAADWVKAKPSAVPRNGAVHGVARTVAKTPWKNEPASPSSAVQPSNPRFALCGSEISKTPNRFSAKTSTTALMNKNEIRIGELQRPSDLMSGRFQCDEQQARAR